MDLLEIRKKAKGIKEAAPEEAAASAEIPDVSGAAETRAEGPVRPKQGARKKRSAPKKAVAEAPVTVEDAPAVRHEIAAVDDGEASAAGVDEVAAVAETVASEPALPPFAEAEAAEAGFGRGCREDEVVEYLAFMLADEEYAVKVEDIKEIIRPQRSTNVPRTPGFVVGIISLRGVILPVFDIKKRLGFEDAGRAKTARVIIVSDGASPLGILVDKVTGVVKMKKGEIEPPPAVIGGVESEYLHGVGRQGDRLLILFNTLRVLEMEGR